MHYLKRIFILIPFLITPMLSFAEGDSSQYREELFGWIYSIVTYASILFGVIMIATAFVKLKDKAERPNDPKTFSKSIIATIVGGALLINFSTSIGIISTTFLGWESSNCFLYEDSMDFDARKDLDTHNCWDKSASDFLSPELQNRITESGASVETINEWISNGVAVIQILSFIWFMKAIFLMKQVSEGGNEGFGKPIGQLFGAAALFNVVLVVELLKNTLTAMGWI
jgi:hypothetical protein